VEKNGSNINGQTGTGNAPFNGTPFTFSYTPQEAGDYSVTVSADGFANKTSNVVKVTGSVGGGHGTNVSAKYRGIYPDHASEKVAGVDEDLTHVMVNETTITWVGGTNGSFSNVSTGSDQNMTWALGGTWAYLFSGNNKIGIVYTYSAFGYATVMEVVIGHDYVQAFVTTVASSMGMGSIGYADIDASVKNVAGEMM